MTGIFFMIGIKKKSLGTRFCANTQNIEDLTKTIGVMDLIWNSKIGNSLEPVFEHTGQAQNASTIDEQNMRCVKIFYDKNNIAQKYDIINTCKKTTVIANKYKPKRIYLPRQKIKTKKYTGSKTQRLKSYDKKTVKKYLEQNNNLKKKIASNKKFFHNPQLCS